MAVGGDNKTYYDVLEIDPKTSDLLAIKKAYRRLALLNHPDRNTDGNSEEATQRFQRINEAYEVLSDPSLKAKYDQQLRYSGGGGGSTSPVAATTTPATTGVNTPFGNPPYHHTHSFQRFSSHHNYHYRDPFAQFNDLFHNDPFFKDAFKEMDDAFAQKFRHGDDDDDDNYYYNDISCSSPPSPQRNNGNSRMTVNQQQQQQQTNNENWICKLLRTCGIEFQMTTYSSDGTNVTASHYSNNARKGAGTGTSKTTKSFINNQGQKVTKRSMIQNGNRLDETYVNGTLVEQRVNGRIEPLSVRQGSNNNNSPTMKAILY